MNKKADETMWIIIGAVLALAVLIFLIYMFTSQGGKANTVISTCSGKGGQCFSSSCGREEASDYPVVLGIGCEKDGKQESMYYCCGR